ncbi:carboxypeptidase regulatory-like domain-containing protein [Silvibacterium acidisoli]|uniref:carboxypeptidase regulatory-like domain-containing protein n=1 Tax=Acidobacteriaceae bacterium ZG23-2 TaxID=2883246 RepID=UPI00406C58AF
MKQKSTLLLWSFLLSFAVCLSGMAQTVTGSVRGTITDPSGAIVPNAKVTAINTATGVKTTDNTNNAGEYSIRFLQIGQYTLTVEIQGFNTAHYGPFSLEIDQVAKIDIPLSIGQTSTTVTVQENTQPILQTENATNGETFTENTINSVPLNGRDFSQLTVFTPGAVSTGYGTYGSVSGSSSNSSERSTNANNEANVNGSRQQSNNFLLDGQEINENLNNTIGYSPSPDSLEQVRVVASNANAEFGNVNGGEVIMVMKSGSNQIHGSGFGFLSNDNLNANSWQHDFQGVPKSAYTQTIFGGTLGGPIIKNKLFFFIDYEGFRYHSSGQATASVAPAAFRTGDLSVLQNLGIHLYDTQAPGRPAYANNQIPILSPVAAFLFSHPEAYPLPNHQSTTDPLDIYQNYIGPSKVFSRNDQGDVKIDWNIHNNDTLSARYSQGYAQDGTVAVPIPVQFPSASNYPDHLGTITWTHTLSPEIVNYARASYSRIQFNSGVTTDPSGIFGFNGNSIVGIPSNPQQVQGFSQQSINGIGGTTAPGPGYLDGFGANPTPEIFVDNVFEYADNLTWQRGKHLFKFGVQFARYQQNSFYPGNDGELGDFTYNGQYSSLPSASTFYPFADFILDRANDVQIGNVTGLTGQRQWRDGVFAQDDWKVTDKMTLNLGVRWEYDQPIYEVNNKMANIDTNTGQIIYAGVNGASRALYDPTYTQFQPRFGFAYQATPRFVVRGGYGITSYLEGMGANLRLTQNPPFHTDFEQLGVNPSDASNGQFYSTVDGFPTTQAATTTFYVWPKDLKPSSTQEFTLMSEYELTPSSTIQVGYVGILGHHLTDPWWGNQLTSIGGTAPYADIVGQNGIVKFSLTNGASNYNALQAVFRQRLTAGLELTANYTYSKSLTDSFGYYGVSSISGQYYQQNAYDMRSEWGPSGFDTRHALSVTGTYDLPFGRGKRFGGNMNRVLDEAVGGWKLSGSNVSYGAFPVTLTSPSHYSSSLHAADARPNQLRPLHVTGRSISAWWGPNVQGTNPGAACVADQDNGTCVFQQQSATSFGDVRPFSLRGPGYEQVDMSVAKSFSVWREQHFDFRADFFNAFNIASYSPPDSGVSNTTFGQITNTNSTERHIQLSLKYAF